MRKIDLKKLAAGLGVVGACIAIWDGWGFLAALGVTACLLWSFDWTGSLLHRIKVGSYIVLIVFCLTIVVKQIHTSDFAGKAYGYAVYCLNLIGDGIKSGTEWMRRDVSRKDNRLLFPTSEYINMLEDKDEENIEKFILEIREALKYHKNIVIDLLGGADSTRIKYVCEYTPIDGRGVSLKADINDNYVFINLKEGSQVSNGQLAFLRAYVTEVNIRKRLSAKELKRIRFSLRARTKKETDPQYRCCFMSIRGWHQ